jgi:chromosome partition protein MukE
VVADDNFPAVDLALRRGRHVHKGDEGWYAFLFDAQPLLEAFYLRYGYELVHRSDGYFFLLPASDGLGKRHLSVAEMIVGQGLALAYLEPTTLEKGAVITREELINQLASAMGTDTLLRALNPKRKRQDERVAQRTARLKVGEALRRLALLGFVELLDGDQLRLAPSLLRFAEPVRGLEAPSEALRKLLERGEVSLSPGDVDASDGEEVPTDDPEETDSDELEHGADAGALAATETESAAGAHRHDGLQATSAEDATEEDATEEEVLADAGLGDEALGDEALDDEALDDEALDDDSSDAEADERTGSGHVFESNAIGEDLWTDVPTPTETERA